MSKLKENILFVLIFFIGFVVGITLFEFYDKIAIEKNIVGGAILTVLVLLDKIYKFSDKIKRMLTFIK